MVKLKAVRYKQEVVIKIEIFYTTQFWKRLYVELNEKKKTFFVHQKKKGFIKKKFNTDWIL